MEELKNNELERTENEALNSDLAEVEEQFDSEEDGVEVHEDSKAWYKNPIVLVGGALGLGVAHYGYRKIVKPAFKACAEYVHDFRDFRAERKAICEEIAEAAIEDEDVESNETEEEPKTTSKKK